MWEYIILLKKEADIYAKEDSIYSVYDQLPFFACVNNLLEDKCQKDIRRYIYTQETNTPIYPGHYGVQPKKWIDKYFIIKESMDIRMKKLNQEKAEKDGS